MQFKSDLFYRYLTEAPLPLALERMYECLILQNKEFKRPILDLGSGDGIFAQVLFAEPIDIGVEPNLIELERSKKYNIYKELINCTGDKIPKPADSIQTIFTNSVLEHIPDLDNVLKELKRVLHPQGRIYVTIPTDLFDKYSIAYQGLRLLKLNKLAEKYRLFFNKFWNHYNFHNVQGWADIFKSNGLRVVSFREYNPKSTCLLNDFLAPFCLISFISRKVLKRWFIFPKLRKYTAKILSSLFFPIIKNNFEKNSNCGLVFFELAKKES